MATKLARAAKRRKRQYRIRKKIKGIADCPRLSVFRSTRHICVQAIDDVSGKTLASASTYEKELFKTAPWTAANNTPTVASNPTLLMIRLRIDSLLCES